MAESVQRDHGELHCSVTSQTSYRTACSRQECGSGKAVKKTTNKHCSRIVRNGTRDQPEEEEDERADVDWTPAVELSHIILSHIILSPFAHPLFQFPMMLVRALPLMADPEPWARCLDVCIATVAVSRPEKHFGGCRYVPSSTTKRESNQR